MPGFVDPFLASAAARKMTRAGLIRALRLNLAAGQEAMVLCTAHAGAAAHPLAKKVLLAIAGEERESVGEFEELFQMLTGDEYARIAHGQEEVRDRAAAMAAGGEEMTTGSWKEREEKGR